MPFLSASQYTAQARSLSCAVDGSTGPTGPRGPAGIGDLTGATGPSSTGPTGPSFTGPAGPTGSPGTGVTTGQPANSITYYDTGNTVKAASYVTPGGLTVPAISYTTAQDKYTNPTAINHAFQFGNANSPLTIEAYTNNAGNNGGLAITNFNSGVAGASINDREPAELRIGSLIVGPSTATNTIINSAGVINATANGHILGETNLGSTTLAAFNSTGNSFLSGNANLSIGAGGLTITGGTLTMNGFIVSSTILQRLIIPTAYMYTLGGGAITPVALVGNVTNAQTTYASIWPGSQSGFSAVALGPQGVLIPALCTYTHYDGNTLTNSYSNTTSSPILVRAGTTPGQLGFFIQFGNFGTSTYIIRYT